MINLLPPKEKIRRERETDVKLVLVVAILLVSFLAVLILSFLAVKFYVVQQIDNQKDLIKLNDESLYRSRSIQTKVAEVNNILRELNDFYKEQFIVSNLLVKINNLLAPEVKIESFLFKKQDNQVTISGKAPTLEQANEFRNNLKTERTFDQLEFSLINWLQGDDGLINFRASFNIIP